MEAMLKECSFESKKEVTIPADATITKKSYRMTVEEIENGFILSKSWDIEFVTASGEKSYEYYTQRWHTKDNPMTIKEGAVKEKSLAEKID